MFVCVCVCVCVCRNECVYECVYMFCAPILSLSLYVNRQTFENVTSIYQYTFYVFRGRVRLF